MGAPRFAWWPIFLLCLLFWPGAPSGAGGAEEGADAASADDGEPTPEGGYGAPSPQPPAADEPIPDKVGAEVHLTKKERTVLKKLECSMCKAILHEMHVEVAKHKMTKKGWGAESQVWETSNAICLAMLQKYRLDISGPKLERKKEGEDDEETLVGRGANAADVMRAMLVLKMGCQRWVEDYGGDTSGYVFKSVRDGGNTPDGAAQDFCVRTAHLCGKGKKEKQQKTREKERERMKTREALIKVQETEEAKQKEKDPFNSLPEDSKFGLQRMLEMARDDPLHYMEDDAKERVRQARSDLRCDVCRMVLDEVYNEVSKRPRSMQREYDILPFAEGACEGGKDLSVPSYFGVEPPPLPPVWADKVRPHLQKKTQRYVLRRYAKKAAKARLRWRALLVQGTHKPPPPGEGEGDMMLTLACKDVLEPARMAEALYEQMAACRADGGPGAPGGEGAAPPCDPALAAARLVCRAADGAACSYAGHFGGVGDGGEEL